MESIQKSTADSTCRQHFCLNRINGINGALESSYCTFCLNSENIKFEKNMIFACNEYTIFSTDWNLLSEWFDSFLSSLMKIRWKLIQFICSSAKVHSISLFFIVGSTCKRSSFICSEVNWRRLPLPNNSKPTQN